METAKSQSKLLLRAVSCVLLTFVAAWVVHVDCARVLAKIDTMSAADFIAKQRHIYSQPYLASYIVALLAGGIYLGAVELVSCLLGSVMRKARKA